MTKERIKFHIPEGPHAYSRRTWTVPDVDMFRNDILAEPMIYHVGHLAEDCEIFTEDTSLPMGHDKHGNVKYHRHLSEESEDLCQIRAIAQEESDSGRVILYQKKIHGGSSKPVIYGKTSMKPGRIKKRLQTKPIFEYRSHPVGYTG